MITDVEPRNNEMCRGETRVYPIACALTILDRLLQPGHIRANVHVVEARNHDGEQEQSTTTLSNAVETW